MVHRHAFEALSRTLCEICDSNRPMGGVVTVFAEEFRQILPVVLKGILRKIVNDSPRRSWLWYSVKFMELTESKSVDTSEKEFSNWLMDAGERKLGQTVPVPGEKKQQNFSLEASMDRLFLHFKANYLNTEINSGRAVLSTTRKDVGMVNDVVSPSISADLPMREYLIRDSISEEEGVAADAFPEE